MFMFEKEQRLDGEDV